MIDTKKPVSFYDDRKFESGVEFCLSNILYEDEILCLCTSGNQVILFSKEDGEVLTNNYRYWFARNKQHDAA